MKGTIILVLLLGISLSAFAQKVKIKKDEIIVDGQKIGLIKQEKAIPMNKSILLESLSGEQRVSFIPENVMVKDSTQIKYKVIFHGLNKSAYVDLSIGAKKFYVNKLIKTEALSASGLNEEGVDRFIEQFGFKELTNLTPNYNASSAAPNSSDNPPYTIVQRNRNASIMVINGSIKQGGRDIARYQESSYTEKGKLMVQLIISDVEGGLILKASFPKFNSSQASYQVSGDKEAYMATIDENGTTNMRIKSLVAYLVDREVF